MDMKRSILLFPVAAILLALFVSSCRDAVQADLQSDCAEKGIYNPQPD